MKAWCVCWAWEYETLFCELWLTFTFSLLSNPVHTWGLRIHWGVQRLPAWPCPQRYREHDFVKAGVFEFSVQSASLSRQRHAVVWELGEVFADVSGWDKMSNSSLKTFSGASERRDRESVRVTGKSERERDDQGPFLGDCQHDSSFLSIYWAWQ